MANTTRCFLVLFSLLPLSFLAEGQTPSDGVVPPSGAPPIATDRPDQTESPVLVPKGLFQVEYGFVYELDKSTETRERNITYGTVLVKYGLVDNLELRLVNEYTRSSTHYSSDQHQDQLSGFQPVTVGTKLFICEQQGFLPKLSLITHVALPYFGKSTFRPSFLAPSFRFVAQHALSERTAFSYNLGAEWDGNQPNTTGIYTAALSHGMSQKLGLFVEVYGFVTEATDADHRLDAGVTFLLSNQLQLDASAGMGITAKAPDAFVGCGVSWRFPH